MTESSINTDSRAKSLKRFAPLMLIALVLAAFFALGGPKYFNLETLRDNREALAGFVEGNFALSIIGFVALYAVLVGISFPGASIMSLFGGFLFGTFVGAGAIVVGATIGATLIFLAARYAVGDSLRAKAGPYMAKFEDGLKQNELSYMFILRLIPAFPFFIVNIVPALFDVKMRNYIIATFFGIMPGSLVYASVGAGVGTVFEQGGEVNLSGLMLQPKVILPIVGLITLSLLPIVYKKFKGATPPAISE